MKIELMMGGVEKAGGAERVMTVLANTFSELGHDVELLVLSNLQPFYKLNDTVEYVQIGKVLNIPGVRLIHKLVKARHIVRNRKPDAVISFITPFNCMTLLLIRGLGIPVFVSERIDPKTYDNTKIGNMRSLLYPFSTGVICQTTEAKEYFKSSKFYDKCSIIPNPLAKDIIKKSGYDETYRMCAVGRLTSQKNYSFMIHAFQEFHKAHAEYHLDIFGEGEKKNELLELTKKLSLEDHIHFMGNVNDLSERLANYDLYLMTSDYEGMSNALAEALAAGLPCIATDCGGGGAKDLIENEETGILIPLNNQHLFVNKMIELVENTSKREKLGRNAVSIKSRLSKEHVANQWIELIDNGIRGQQK